MRFNDSLRTVLQSDSSPGVGARSTWRQLVDLAGRGRVTPDEPVIARLRMLRQAVPAEVRAASARALAYARPDVALVEFFAEDTLAVAAPVLRTADLPAADWIAILPRLSPPLRSVLRNRRDLDPEVVRALESFGAVDFTLPQPAPAEETSPQTASAPPVVADELAPAFVPPAGAPLSESPFVALGEVARGLPVVAEALARIEPAPPPPANGFAISDLVARIEAFRTGRGSAKEHIEATPTDQASADGFRFETDATGVVIGVEGVARGALVGLSITHSGLQGFGQLDGVASGAFRRRSRFDDARLEVGGASSASGSWRLSAVPAFDPVSGRFIGYRGVGRRPRADESAARPRNGSPSADSLRQLAHELRTPTNAIAGFAELIESELLGPVPDPYRARATEIRVRAGDLLAAIEDLDTASRIEMGALELRPGPVPLQPLIDRVMADLAPLAAMRGVRLVVDMDEGARALADDRAVERVLSRLLATLVAAGSAGEALRLSVYADPASVAVAVDRPGALIGLDADALLALDAEEGVEGAPLLGAGFALRVARNLVGELGGALEFGPKRLTLRLPAVEDHPVEHATTI